MLTSTNNSIENGPNDAQTAAPTKADLSIDSQFICVSCSFQGNMPLCYKTSRQLGEQGECQRTGRTPENRVNGENTKERELGERRRMGECQRMGEQGECWES